MKVLVIGSGGREHAITWKLKQSPRVTDLYAAPGNPGMAKLAKCIDIPADDIEDLLNFAQSHAIDLTVVGPEVPLVEGIVNLFQAEGLKIFGPNRYAAQFEGSKSFSKNFMDKHQIPTAAYGEYDQIEVAKQHVEDYGFPLVIKADGLAAGKGVVICQDRDQALEALDQMMSQDKFGQAGSRVVFEEFMTGIEASVLCFVDGKTILPMASAQDYKRAYDGDQGLNTGGMGAYSPSQIMTPDLEQHIKDAILDPFLRGIQAEAIDYKGILFVGLMLENGKARVVEFNCRMGDPETQVVLPRMENDLLDVIEACIDQKLEDINLTWSDQATVALVLASGGYPEAYEKNKVIEGLDQLEDEDVFHAGTRSHEGQVVTSGGRVLNVLGQATSLEEARIQAYNKVKQIKFDQMMYRKDIAKF